MKLLRQMDTHALIQDIVTFDQFQNHSFVSVHSPGDETHSFYPNIYSKSVPTDTSA